MLNGSAKTVGSFNELNVVFSEIPTVLLRIPLEFHTPVYSPCRLVTRLGKSQVRMECKDPPPPSAKKPPPHRRKHRPPPSNKTPPAQTQKPTPPHTPNQPVALSLLRH